MASISAARECRDLQIQLQRIRQTAQRWTRARLWTNIYGRLTGRLLLNIRGTRMLNIRGLRRLNIGSLIVRNTWGLLEAIRGLRVLIPGAVTDPEAVRPWTHPFWFWFSVIDFVPSNEDIKCETHRPILWDTLNFHKNNNFTYYDLTLACKLL